MMYMKEERLDIGRQIFEREITIQQAQPYPVGKAAYLQKEHFVRFTGQLTDSSKKAVHHPGAISLVGYRKQLRCLC